MVIKEVKGKQKMVMQGMLQLLKLLLSALHSPLLSSFLADSQASLCRSSVFADFLFFTWPTMGCIFLMQMVYICKSLLSRTFSVKSCLVLASQLGTLCSGLLKCMLAHVR